MRSHDLARLLLAQPDREVTTWDASRRETHAVEQVVLGADEVVMGMEMGAGPALDGAEVVWTAHDVARRGLVKACARWARAKKEWVG